MTFEIGRWDSFGEVSLLYNSRRGVTVTTTEDSKIWAMVSYIYIYIYICVCRMCLKKYKSHLASMYVIRSIYIYIYARACIYGQLETIQYI